MTRKTPSKMRRELEKLRRGRDDEDDEDDGPEEVVVELGGVPTRGPEEDGPRPAAEDGEAFEEFTVNLETGEVSTPSPDAPDDLPECRREGCPNPSLPKSPGPSALDLCEVHAGMPERDWRPVVVENEERDDDE